MKFFQNLSIRNKLISIILLVAVISITTGFTLIISSNIKSYKEDMANETILKAKLVGKYCGSALVFEDSLSVSSYLKELSQVPAIIIGQVFDKNDRVYGTFNRTNVVFKVEKLYNQPFNFFTKEYFEVFEPIVYENVQLGTIFLRASTEQLDEKINKHIRIMLLLLAVLVLFSTLLASWLQRIISQPILNLAKITERISIEEDYSLRVMKQSTDEIGVLYDGFNNMLEQIQQRQGAIDKALMELQESEDKFKQISQSAYDAIIVVDSNGTIQFWNKAAEKIFGYNDKEIIGISLHKLLVSTEDFERFKIASIDYQENHGDIIGESLELPAIRKDNSKFPVEVSIAPIWIKGKWNAVGILKDISERKRVEQELINAKEKAEESDRLKSAFLSNMSHEIRTPMNSIIGFAELLSDPNIFERKRDKYLKYITNSGKSLLNLINDIIDVSKIEAGQLKIKKIDSRINPILTELYTSFHEAHLKGSDSTIEFRLRKGVDDDEFAIHTDPYRFRQILTNLIGNAMKFTETGYIEFGYNFKDEEEVEFYVKDTGIGIPDDKLDIIFDRFGQVEDVYTKNQGGTGLGLAISKKLVEMLGGRIRVESLAGKGSTFFFTLPHKGIRKFIKKAQPMEEVSEKMSGIHDWSEKIILIAEDEDINYMFLNEALNFTHAKILWAKDGRETIEICRNNLDIDLVLMDVKMPEIDGYEATKEIKKFRPELPIIAQTAYAMAGEKEKAVAAECDDFITKPIRPKKLLSVLSKYLD